MARPWIVLKFGGTSVATRATWERIAARVRELAAPGPATEGHRVWIVASALSGVTNALEQALTDATAGRVPESLEQVRAAHEDLAGEMGLSGAQLAPVRDQLTELGKWLEGVRLTGEAPARLRARVLSAGEMMSTRLGVAALGALGLDAQWVDARTLLRSQGRQPTDELRFLEARVRAAPDVEAAAKAANGHDVVLTQGFVARTQQGETCLLGRGGSDTSGALFAVLVAAEEFEIWTDVPGLFTADPRNLPSARLIRRVGYREAQELAAMGARVLHPRCLQPVAEFGIPVSVHSTRAPEIEGTRIEGGASAEAGVTAVTCRGGTTLVTVSTIAMWETPGYLARVFQPFSELGVSVDLVGTSQSAVSVTLDRVLGGAEGEVLEELVERLEELGRVQVVPSCAVVSIVGRRIRSVLHELGPALGVFDEFPVHLISDSSEDLNLSFVVDEGQARKIVARLHARLFSSQGGDATLGPTWEKLQGAQSQTPTPRASWWHDAREQLLAIGGEGQPRYVYSRQAVRERAEALRTQLPSVARFYFAMKANPQHDIVRTVAEQGFGIECVSAGEVAAARELLGQEQSILFTPNFCPVDEYAAAFAAGAEVTVDGVHVLEQALETFRDKEIGLRIDPGQGLGHHEKVKTAGAGSKFGLALDEVDAFVKVAQQNGTRVVGLHAHVGSGVFDPQAWAHTGTTLAEIARRFDDVRWLDLGGGHGVPQRPGERELDLEAVEASLKALREQLTAAQLGHLELRMEPGRYLVSDAGVLIAPVTQVRHKSGINFIGLATGMNSLMRPALYGAWHAIVNLSRLDEPGVDYFHVVGPICESGDVLGRDRWLPATQPGDIVLIANAGAYGACMASSYNHRPPAAELVI